MAKRKPVPLDTMDEALVEQTARAVREAGAVPLKKLSAQPLSRRVELMLFEALERRGFERTPKVVRVSLCQQLADLVRREQRVELKGLKKRLAGCSTDAEAKRTAVTLGLEKKLVWVTTDAGEALVPTEVPVLSPEELGTLATLAVRLTKLTKKLKAPKGQPPRTFERSLVSELFARETTPTQDATGTVLAALRGAKESVFVPELVRRLERSVPSAAVKEVLLVSARAGRVELRPESSIGLLSAEDRALCPSAPDGTPLSYVRLTD